MEDRDRKRKQYGCDGQCYWGTGMCPCVDTCPETRSGEFLATAAGCLVYVLIMLLGAGILFAAVFGVLLAAGFGAIEFIQWIWGMLF